MTSQKLARFVSSSIVIAGTVIPVESWSVTLSAGNSMSTITVESSLVQIDGNGIDIVKLSRTPAGAEFEVFAGYDGNEKLLFSGIVDECDVDETTDSFSISGRDHAAALNDGKQTVAGLKYRNQSIAQIVTQIAQKFGLTPKVTDPGLQAGPLMNKENVFVPRPQSYWSLLQKMAADVGYEVYVTPDKTLVFGPEEEQGSLEVSWLQGPGAENPLENFKWQYQPRNNSNITVKVLSHNLQGAEYVAATATANAKGVSGKSKNTTGKSSPSKAVNGAHGGSGSTSKKKSVYYIHANGLDADAAEKKAEAVAKDLAKRQIIVSGTIEGTAKLKVHTRLNLNGTRFDGLEFNVVEVTHAYSIESNGFTSSFRAQGLVDE